MSLTNTPTDDQIKRVPKALLHDHLDGGLRPQTIIALAQKIGYKKLPTDDPKKLAEWFEESCNSHSLVRYLETFAHTIAVMQTKEAIIQVARECAIDLAMRLHSTLSLPPLTRIVINFVAPSPSRTII